MNVSRARVPAQMVMTAGAAEAESHLWRGLLFETAPPDGVRTASLEAAALAAIPRMTSMHMAILDVAKMRLLRWVTDPMPDVQWKGMVDQRDTPHPEDVKRIFEAVEPMFKGEIESGSVEGAFAPPGWRLGGDQLFGRAHAHRYRRPAVADRADSRSRVFRRAGSGGGFRPRPSGAGRSGISSPSGEVTQVAKPLPLLHS
ncbi:hypothetical protein [Nocardia sp. IFM 10818]